MIIDRVLIITFVSNSLSFEKNYVVRQRNDDSFENFWRTDRTYSRIENVLISR